jgi:hypothetical protein
MGGFGQSLGAMGNESRIGTMTVDIILIFCVGIIV